MLNKEDNFRNNINIVQKDYNTGVAIIGIGFRIPFTSEKCLSSADELYSELLNGFCGISQTSTRWSDNYFKNGDTNSTCSGLLPLDEIKSFDPLFFGINPSDVVLIDPQQRLLLKCVWNALEDGGIDPIQLRSSDTSVFMGASTMDYFQVNKTEKEIPVQGIHSCNYSVSNRISYCFDLRGESLTIDTACSSSLNAINLGYQSVLNLKSKLSIVGGVNIILDPQINILFSQCKMNGPSGRCNTFSSEADGFVRSETVGVVVLKNLKDAINDGNQIYCVIQGASSNVDGNYDKINYISPSKSAQAENIIKALKSTNNQIKASDIDYFECHGTGTPTGDPIECEGISIALNTSERSTSSTTTTSTSSSSGGSNNNNSLLIGSIKSNIGHGEASSGVSGIIKCCIMFKHRQFLPNINFKTPNPNIKFDEWNLKVVTEPIPFRNDKQTIMAINNFGVTGSNCCMILSEYINNKNNIYNNNNSEENKKYIIPLSCNSSTSLDNYKSLISNLSTPKISNTISFQDFVNKQIHNKSTSLIQRTAIIASNWDEFNHKSNEIQSTTINKSIVSNITIQKKNPVTIFVFCGQGSQYNQMALSLYENETLFKSTMNKLDQELSKYYGYSIIDKLRSIEDDDSISIHQPILAIPVNVIVQVSLYELYKSWNIKADIVVGHSFGEIACSYCSGMIDFETLCYLTYHRSIAQNKTIGTGRMLSINISAEEYSNLYSSKYPSIEIACYNSPSSIVIAGNEQLLNEISTDLKSRNVFTAMLGSLSAFHTSKQLMIKDDICSLDFKFNSPTTKVFSTVTSNLFNDQQPFNSTYLFENVLKAVQFSSTISNIYKYIESNDLGNEVVFIEIAPHPTLQYYLNQMKSQQSDYFDNGNKVTVYSALHKKKNDHKEFLKTISTLYVNGYNGINFKSQISNYSNIRNQNINLPSYQWDDKEYFQINPSWEKAMKEGPSINHLGNSNDSPIQSYQTIIDTRKPQFRWLKGHNLKGKPVFPGMGYISNLLSIYGMNQDITINEIQFKTAFNLTDGINNCLETTIIPLSKNEFNIKYHFKDLTTNQWILCAIGNYNLFKHQINNNNDNINNDNDRYGKLDIEELKSKCNYTTISKNELYSSIKNKTGLQYKGLFQGVKECYIGNKCSLSIVSLNEIQNQQEFNHLSYNNNLNSFFNTAILDSCLHGMIQTREQSQIYFYKCEGFKYYSNNISIATSMKDKYQEVYVYCEINPIINSTISGSIKIMLPDGTLLIEIQRAVCKSIIPIIDSTSVIQPSNDIYTPYLQSKDSLINSPSSFKHLYNIEEFKCKEIENLELFNTSICYLFFKYINERCPTLINKESLETLTLDQFKDLITNSSIHQRCIQFVYECLKLYHSTTTLSTSSNQCYYTQQEIDQFINENEEFKKKKILFNTTRIMSKLLFPLENDDPNTDTPQSIFENGLLEDFYNNSEQLYPSNKLLCEIVYESIKPIINKTSTFRILEAGSGVGTISSLIFDKLDQLLQDNFTSSRIDIEFTFTDISTTFLSQAKERYSKYKRFNIIYRLLDLETSLTEGQQDFKSSYYDMVIMSNVLHVVKDIKFSTNEIYKVLKPNGQLLFVEPPYKQIHVDSIFCIFTQWWSYEDNIRNDRCCIEPSKWITFLESFNFKDTIISNNGNKNSCCTILIQCRKPSQQELLSSNTFNQFKSYNQIILFTDENNQQQQEEENNSNNNEIIKLFESLSSTSTSKTQITIIHNIDQFNKFIESSSSNNNNNLIIFLKSINQLNINNYKEITLEYVKINQIITQQQLEKNYKIVLITRDSQSNNYLSGSIFGTSRYLLEETSSKLDIVTIDFDTTSINNYQNVLSIIDYLINTKDNIEREYFIINNQINIERYKNENNIKNQLKSKTFQNNKDELMVQLDTNLEYKLKSRKQLLKPNQIEVEVKATGINYKDYATYIGIIDSIIELDKDKEKDEDYDANYPNIGNDYSGIITRVGSNVTKYKIGDHVCGLAVKSTASHIITEENHLCIKPSNISHVKAASSATIFVTSLHSIYTIGNLKNYETILIHSASGGIGLSALEILKWKGHKGHIFTTVGSDDKAKYLRDHYGSFITDIYSTRDRNYERQIKDKLKSLGCDQDHQGVDLILNTLSSEYIDSNFKCLNQDGRFIDLSITHLTPFDYMNYDRFKFNYSYANIELIVLPFKTFRDYLKKILKAVSSDKLKLIPIIEFSNLEIKKAIEYINLRKHIGKIVVNHDVDIINNLYNQQNQQLIQNNEILMQEKYNISNLNIGRNILLTGQTGIILIILRWLLNYSNGSIDNIIIISKSKLKWELELLINEANNNTNTKRIKIHYKQVDVGNNQELEECLNQLNTQESINDINSIFHFAFINDIGDFESVNIERMNIAHHAKAIGSINLHNQSIERKWNIKQFVLSSSLIAVFGGEKQCCYVSANCVLDSLSKYRKSIGLPSLTINIGAVSSTGFVSRNDAVEANLSNSVLNFITPQLFINTLDLLIQNTESYSNYSHTGFNYYNLLLKSRENPMSLKFDYQLNQFASLHQIKSENSGVALNSDNNDINSLILSKIAELLSIEYSKINTDYRLLDFGLDSLVIVNLKNWIDEKFKVKISIQNLQNNKIIKLCETIKNELNQNNINATKTTKSSNTVTNLNVEKSNNIVNQFTQEFIQNEIRITNDNELIKSRPYNISNIINQTNHSILLTGATGFLGAYLLVDLIKLTSIKSVYCLTRNKTNSLNLIDSIFSNLKNHQLYEDLTNEQINKIIAIKGDITSENLGLSRNDYSNISSHCDILINSAADLNLQQSYEEAKPANVNCIKEIIKLSVSNENQQKLIINFSSISVFFNHKLNNGQEYDEKIINPELENVYWGYAQSKIIAERLLKYYGESKGIPSIVFRLPELWANPTTGIGNDNDTIQTTVQSYAVIGGYTSNSNHNNMFFTPVTTISKYIIKLLLNVNSWSSISSKASRIYSLNGDSINYKLFFDILENHYNCKEMGLDEVQTLIENSTHKSCIKFKTFYSYKDMITSISIDKGFSMSKSTFNLIKSIDSDFNYNNDWNINQEMIINHLNYILNKSK